MKRNALVVIIMVLFAGWSYSLPEARVIKITPTEGPCKTEITITGTGFTNGNTVTVSGACDSTSKVAIAGGAFTATLKADCDKAGNSGVQAFEYDNKDNFIAKSNSLTFKQTSGCKGKEFRTTVLSVETSDNRVLLINHNEFGSVLSSAEDSSCSAGLADAASPAECGSLRILDWAVSGWVVSEGRREEQIEYLTTTGPFDLVGKFSTHWFVQTGSSFTNSENVNTGKPLSHQPHYLRVGAGENHGLSSEAADPDVYFVADVGANTDFLEAAFKSQSGKFVAPFKTLLSTPKGTALAGYSSSTGDIVGFLRPAAGAIESFHRVGSKTGNVTLLRKSNVFGISMDITNLIPDITTTPELTGKRVAVYSVVVQGGAAFTKGVFTQVFDAKGEVLTPRGPAKLIQAFQATPFPTAERMFRGVAIADDGSFAVYVANNPACNKLTVWFQKLNPLTGSKTGPRKPLVDCAGISTSPIGAHALDVFEIK